MNCHLLLPVNCSQNYCFVLLSIRQNSKRTGYLLLVNCSSELFCNSLGLHTHVAKFKDVVQSLEFLFLFMELFELLLVLSELLLVLSE